MFCLGLALLGGAKAGAQSVVLNIDWSNVSAVKITATANFSAINYPTGLTNNITFYDGIALLNFFATPVVVTDFVNTSTGSNLTDSANNPTPNSRFDELTTWNDAHPEYWGTYGAVRTDTGVDLVMWTQGASPLVMSFSTSAPAFHGEAVFDLSGYPGLTSQFPALNTTGIVRVWNNDDDLGNAVIGTWQIVGAAAIPEPSTYAALLGVVALVGAVVRRRRDGLARKSSVTPVISPSAVACGEADGEAKRHLALSRC